MRDGVEWLDGWSGRGIESMELKKKSRPIV
jgi:hypothetical protein